MISINKSVESTIKSISGRKKLNFTFNNENIRIDGNNIFLPNGNLLKNENDIKNFRGITDFLALKLKFHNSKLYNKYKPINQIKNELFDALEESRIVSLGYSAMIGIASNLKIRIKFFCKKNHFEKIKK